MLLGFADSPDWRVFWGVLDKFDVLCVVFIQSKGEIFNCHAVCCSCRPRKQTFGVRSHQTVWTRTCGLPFPSFFFPTAHFLGLLSDFSPCSATCLCLVAAVGGLFPPELASSFFESSLSLLGIGQ